MDEKARNLERMQRFADDFFPRLEREFKVRSLEFEAQVVGSMARTYSLPLRDHLNVEHPVVLAMSFRPKQINPAPGTKHGLTVRVTWKEEQFHVNMRRTYEEDVMNMSPMKTVDAIIMSILDYEHERADEFQKDADMKAREEEIAKRTCSDAERLVQARKRKQDRKQQEREAFQALKSNLPSRFSAVRQDRGFAITVNCGARGANGMSPEDMEQLAKILTVWSRGKFRQKKGTPK